MDNQSQLESIGREPKKRSMTKIIFIVISLTVVVTLLLSFLAYRYFFPAPFKPVALNNSEKVELQEKLEDFGMGDFGFSEDNQIEFRNEKKPRSVESAKPEVYKENSKKRVIKLSERELNALIANNKDLARKVAVKLSSDMMSLKIIIPVDSDFPIIGGKTIKGAAGVELAYKDSTPKVILKGVSLWGVPIPSAWLGGLKNIDLVQEFGGDKGFWKSFSDGVEFIDVEDGHLTIKLKE